MRLREWCEVCLEWLVGVVRFEVVVGLLDLGSLLTRWYDKVELILK